MLKDFGDNTHLAFSLASKVLAVADHEQGVWLLDSATGQPIGGALSGGGPIAFSPDGKTLACRSYTRDSFTFYDVATRKSIGNVKAKKTAKKSYRFAAFSRDGRSFACVEKTGTVHLLDVQTNKELATRNGGHVVKLVFAPDGNLVTAGLDEMIRVWDAKTGQELRQLGKMAAAPSLIDCLADGKTVVAACAGQICSWDVASGQATQPTLVCKGLRSPRILSADGTKLIERDQDTLSIWDVATGQEIGPAAGAPRSIMNHMAFAPDGNTLATSGYAEGEIKLWEVATGKPLGILTVPDTASYIHGLAWPSRGMLMAQAFRSPGGSGPAIAQLTMTATRGPAVKTQMCPDGAKFSADGQVLARMRGKRFELLDVSTKKVLSAVPCRIEQPGGLSIGNTLTFSADHQILVTRYSNEPTITLWEVSTGRELYSFDLPLHLPRSAGAQPTCDKLIGLSPDGRLVVTQNPLTMLVSLWEHVSGQLRLSLSPPPEWVPAENNVAFSPDSRLLAIGYMTGAKEERSIHVWDLATGEECQRFHGHKAGTGLAGAPQVVFSPDGRRLASAGMDYTVLIWDVKQPPALARPNQPLGPKEVQALKTALVGADAAAAHRAIWKLQQVPEQAVPLVAECLRPQHSASDSKQVLQEVSRLIDDLDSNDFSTRAKASEMLSKKLRGDEGMLVENALRQMLPGERSIEVSKAIKHLLDKLGEAWQMKGWGGARSPELTRMFRGIEVLELIHNEAARGLLRELVAVPPRPEVRREAEAALKRLTDLSPASARP